MSSLLAWTEPALHVWRSFNANFTMVCVALFAVALLASNVRTSTIKITKTGAVPPPRRYDLRCARCGTEFTCAETDLETVGEPCEGGAGYGVTCPLRGCGATVSATETTSA